MRWHGVCTQGFASDCYICNIVVISKIVAAFRDSAVFKDESPTVDILILARIFHFSISSLVGLGNYLCLLKKRFAYLRTDFDLKSSSRAYSV